MLSFWNVYVALSLMSLVDTAVSSSSSSSLKVPKTTTKGGRSLLPDHQLDEIEIGFSLWYPPLYMSSPPASSSQQEQEQQQQQYNEMNGKKYNNDVIDLILLAINSFICNEEERDWQVVNDDMEDTCVRSTSDHEGSDLSSHHGMTFRVLQESSESVPTIISEKILDLMIYDDYTEDINIRWTTWSIVYSILQIGDSFYNQGPPSNMNDEYMSEQTIQLLFDVAILEGKMDGILREVFSAENSNADTENAYQLPRMSVLGHEEDTFHPVTVLQEVDKSKSSPMGQTDSSMADPSSNTNEGTSPDQSPNDTKSKSSWTKTISNRWNVMNEQEQDSYILRVIGVFLLVLDVGFYMSCSRLAFIYHQEKIRKQQRQDRRRRRRQGQQMEQQKQGLRPNGNKSTLKEIQFVGLTTQADIDHMLEISKR